jgi:hypothetical protein
MGKYINQDSKGNMFPASASGKIAMLKADGAEQVYPDKWVENLVCVVDNGMFGAAGYAYCSEEFKAFNNPEDFRPKKWFIYEHAKELAE